MKQNIKTALTILLILFTSNLLASGKITPEDKAKISRNIGESVYVECKKAGPYSTNCRVDCGNGQRFRKASGYCYYMSQGTFMLNVSTRHRNKDIFHTATVFVSKKMRHTPRVVNTSSAGSKLTQARIHHSKHITPSFPSNSNSSNARPNTRPSVSTNLSGGSVATSNSQTFSDQIDDTAQLSATAQTASVNDQNALTQEEFSQALQNTTQDISGIANQNTLNNNFSGNSTGAGGSFSEANSGISSGNSNQNQNQNNNQFVSN